MNYPFDMVVQHHEGAGAPTDNIMRFAPGGYTYGIGVNKWGLFREPSQDYSTIDFNHVVVGVCLSGDRNTYPVTDSDIQMMAEIASHARGQGWLVANPAVEPHRWMPGSNTVCPGNLTMERWDHIIDAYSVHPKPPGDDVPADKDVVSSLRTKDGAWKLQYDGGIQTIDGTFYGSYFSLPVAVRNDPTRRFLTIMANSGAGYSIISLMGEVYSFTVPQ